MKHLITYRSGEAHFEKIEKRRQSSFEPALGKGVIIIPIRGIILVFIFAIVIGVINKDEIYIWLKRNLNDDNNDNEEDIE